jgi:hypothetical protein
MVHEVRAAVFEAPHHPLRVRQFPFAELVPRTFALDEIEAALHYARESRPFRVGIVPR